MSDKNNPTDSHLNQMIEISMAGESKGFREGEIIYLKADTGKYLSRWGNTDIWAAKDDIDQFCRFTVHKEENTENYRITLQADTGKYLSRWGDVEIKAAKDRIDEFCWLTPWWIYDAAGNMWLALQADTGKYLTRWGDRETRVAKDGIDRFCRFKVEHITS